MIDAWPGFLIALIGLLLLGFVWIGDAGAHAWYDPACCQSNDCAKITSIRRAPDGRWFVTTKHGSMVFDKNVTIRNSKDGDDHACIFKQIQVAPGLHKGRCLYFAVRT